jgi:starch synthase
MTKLKVLSVTSEIYPLIKTGGLADVTGALPKAVAAEGVDMRTLVPGYPAVLGALEEAQELLTFPGLFGTARLLAGKSHGLTLYVLDAPYLYGRPGNPYTAPDGTDWPDNAYRFGALAKVAAEIGLGLLPAFEPDVVHMHDWQAALTAAYLHYSGKAAPGMVITVHNLAFQGQFPAELVMPLGLPPASFAMDGVEHYGKVGFLKAALQLADRITTVSPTYAMEIMQAENGMGFEGLLRARSAQVSGILNGIDTAVWDPANDPALTKGFDAGHLDARASNKLVLRNVMGLNQEPGALLVGVVSRLSGQKGIDLLLEALPTLLGEGMQLVLLGSGEAELERQLLAAAGAYPGKIGVKIGYDETLAHRIQGGSDALLVPSRFEPCGLTQLAALRYGAVPVVARVGGLSDTVIDANEMALAAGVPTGVQFYPVNGDSLAVALWRTARLFRDRHTWRTMQKNGMETDVSWRRPAHRYASLYLELHGSKGGVAASRGGRSNVVSIDIAGADSARGKAPGVEAVGLEAGKSKAAGVEPVSLEAGKGIVAGVEPASREAGKGIVAGVQPASLDAGMGKVAGVETASLDAGNGKAVGVETASLEAGNGKAAGMEMTSLEAWNGKVAGVEMASLEAGKSKVAGVEPASPEAGNGKVAGVEMASLEAGKSKVAGVEPASLEAGKGKVVGVEPASFEASMGKVAGAGMASPEGWKSKPVGIEPASLEDERGKAADAGAASLEDTDDKVAGVEPAGFGVGKDKAASAETAGPENTKSSDSSTGAGASEGEADNVVSIAWRDA